MQGVKGKAVGVLPKSAAIFDLPNSFLLDIILMIKDFSIIFKLLAENHPIACKALFNRACVSARNA